MPFDQARADRAIRFYERCTRHSKGAFAGKPFILMPWQRQIVSDVFGTIDEDGMRQYREVYLEVGKKNGKSTWAAATALYMLVADNEPGAEVYCAATTKDQASIVFNECSSMVSKSPVLRKALRVLGSTKRIVKRDDPTSVLRAIASDGDALDGINPSGVIIDELHRFKQQKALELYEVLHRGTVTRRQPLVIQITTAGVPDEAPICYPKHNYCRNIEKGIIKDRRFYGKIFGVEPEEADGEKWMDEALWYRANPSLGHAFSIEAMRDIALKAKNDPAQLPHFKRYHLSVWGQHEQRAIDLIDWDKCAEGLRPLNGRICYAGLDCSFKYDLTSLVLLFPDDDNETFDVLPFFWLPRDELRRAGRRDKVPYEHWASNGVLDTCDGNVIDMADIEKRLLWAQETFDLQEVAFDPWSATEFSIRMADQHGMTFVPIRQGFQSMSEPTKKVIELVKTARLRHGGNPLLRWNADSMVLRDDGNNNIMPTKPNRQASDKRIDGMVALIMATDRAIRNGYGVRSVYEDRGLVYA